MHAAQLVPAVTELIIAELLYLQYKDRQKPIFLYINSTGTTRADGETVRHPHSVDVQQVRTGAMRCESLVCQNTLVAEVCACASTALDASGTCAGNFADLLSPLSCRSALRQRAQPSMTP